MEKFENMQVLDFSNPDVLKKQNDAVEAVKQQLGKEYPNYINGEATFTEKKTKSYNPGNKDELVGIFQKAGKDHAEMAIQAADEAFKTWKNVPAEERAQYLFKAAAICKRRRYEINAWMITEAGKNYPEADADTCEAIDFLDFYGREAIRYAQRQEVTEFPGEDNHYFYIPLGVGLSIPPWNFPFAIMVGITTAAIAAGNTVVMKPSSETPMMAWLLADIFNEIGLPKGVLNYLVASGAEAGDYMVDHPKVRFISFTGSMEVGMRINERAAKVNPGQIWLKRVVAEMGGKDAIVVDSEADLVAAADAVITSAFGFQGQKCSACSRAIVDEKIYDEFCVMLAERANALPIGDPRENVKVGPVVSQTAYNDVLRYIEIGKNEGTVIAGGEATENTNGYYIKPTIIKDIDRNARLAQEEIFGPVLSVIKAKDYDDALDIANGTIYGLTGAVFTNNIAKLERARSEFHVGNLYLNRKCTGALVDVQPFGGFNMSGTDSKAGSRDYLALFMQGKSVTTRY